MVELQLANVMSFYWRGILISPLRTYGWILHTSVSNLKVLRYGMGRVWGGGGGGGGREGGRGGGSTWMFLCVCVGVVAAIVPEQCVIFWGCSLVSYLSHHTLDV